jgi:hypothetical protein
MPRVTDPGITRRRKYHFTTQERRKELWDHFEDTGSADDLGVYLHAQQDSYSHEGLSPINGQVRGAPWNWKKADDTWRDVSKADVMAEDTYNHLDWGAEIMENKGTLTGRVTAMPWGRISGLVHSFNATSNEGEKRYLLTVLEASVRSWQREQFKKEQIREFRRETRQRKSE